MSLRRAKVCDLEAIVAIDHEVLQTNWHENLYLDEIVGSESLFYVLILETELVGFIILRKSDTIYEVLQFAVAQSHQNKGLGSILLELSLENLEAEAVFLEVSSTNLAAQYLYRKYGFESLRIRKNYYALNDDAIVMRKRLI